MNANDIRKVYDLSTIWSNGGKVRFSKNEVQSVCLFREHVRVILSNGRRYTLSNASNDYKYLLNLF